MEEGSRVDADIARERALQIQRELQQNPLEPGMSPSLEREVVAIIEQARKDLVR